MAAIDFSFQESLRHVFWIGGTPCSGKTTVAQYLAKRYKLCLYARDEVVSRHDAVIAAYFPSSVCARLASLTVDERWVARSGVEIAETSISASRERFPLLVEDLLCLPRHSIILVEGIGLDPDLVRPLIANDYQAVWLIANEDLSRSVWHTRRKQGTANIVDRTSNPSLAFNNLLHRSAYLSEYLKRIADDVGLHTIVLEPMSNVDMLIRQVEIQFQRYVNQLFPSSGSSRFM